MTPPSETLLMQDAFGMLQGAGRTEDSVTMEFKRMRR